MGDPELLLLDEPSLGLAPLIVRDIFEIISRIRNEGKSILIVEQNAFQTLKIADYAYVLELGKVKLEGKANDLLNNDELINAYLGQKEITKGNNPIKLEKNTKENNMKKLVLALVFMLTLSLAACGSSLPNLDVEELDVPAVPAGLVQGVTATSIKVGNTASKTGAFGVVGIPFSAAIEAVFNEYNLTDAVRKN